MMRELLRCYSCTLPIGFVPKYSPTGRWAVGWRPSWSQYASPFNRTVLLTRFPFYTTMSVRPSMAPSVRMANVDSRVARFSFYSERFKPSHFLTILFSAILCPSSGRRTLAQNYVFLLLCPLSLFCLWFLLLRNAAWRSKTDDGLCLYRMPVWWHSAWLRFHSIQKLEMSFRNPKKTFLEWLWGNTENETVAYLQFSISCKKELNEIDKEWKITHVSRSREPTNYFFF